MNLYRLILRSLLYYWQTNLAVVLGLALASAVATGSLVVGDSVWGNLRDMALRRLGRIEYALIAPHFFPANLAERIQKTPAGAEVVPAAIFRGAATGADSGATVPHVNVIGINDPFWKLWNNLSAPSISGRRVAINAALARDLSVKPGDAILLTVERHGAAPPGTLFSRRKRQDISRSMRLEVAAVLPDDGVGGFHLGTSSLTPRNVFIADDWLMKEMGLNDRANALLVAFHDKSVREGEPPCEPWFPVNTGGTARTEARPPGDKFFDPLQTALKSSVTLADYGIKMVPSTSKGWFIQSNRLVMDDALVRAIQTTATGCDAFSAHTSIYLADRITVSRGSSRQPRQISYAVVAGVEPFCHFDQFPMFFTSFSFTESHAPQAEEIWLREWAATDLETRPGDHLELSFLTPSADGQYRSQRLHFTVRQTIGNRFDFSGSSIVPDFTGITDAQTVNGWQPPFPIDFKRVTARDEEYWKRWRATPRAFVSLDVARRMWQSRPGESSTPWVTAVHVLPKNESTLLSPDALSRFEQSFTQALLRALEPNAFGMAFRPVRQEALAAAEGTTDFSRLFLAMSFFLLLAGVGLAAMLMRLSVERRAAQAGILLACGISPSLVTRVLISEGIFLAGIGAATGVPLGIGYAWGIVKLMAVWWVGEGTDAFAAVHVTAASVLIGGATGFFAGVLSAWWSVRSLGRYPVLELLAGWGPSSGPPAWRRRGWVAAFPVTAMALAIGLVLFATGTGLVSPTIAFFFSGAALLLAGVGGARWTLARSTMKMTTTRNHLALRNLSVYPSRALLVFGVLASAGFILVAVAANLRDLSRSDWTRKDSGAGGFALVGASSVPLPVDFSSAAGRRFLGFAPDDEKCLAGVRVIPFLMSGGEDISCLNLARPTAPRVLGVPPAMIERGGFAVCTKTPSPTENPWENLRQGDSANAFGDADSVQWSLHSGLGQSFLIRGEGDARMNFRFAGLLPGSIFAGEILVSEHAFRQLFPSIQAPRYFLIETPPGREMLAADALRRNLGDLGLEVRRTTELMNRQAAVQNTYLRMFLALGGLGFALGTVGLVLVLLRSALERRREFALMLAVGFGRHDLTRLLWTENAGLLVAGLACGTVAALVGVAPQVAVSGGHVNWLVVAPVLGGILAVGMTACAWAARAATEGKLIEALREE